MDEKALEKLFDKKMREMQAHSNNLADTQSSKFVMELKSDYQHLKEITESGFNGVNTRLDLTNGKVLANTEHRIKTDAQVSVWRWIVAILGVGNIAWIIKNIAGGFGV